MAGTVSVSRPFFSARLCNGETQRTIHVLNAPSLVATSAILIGRHIALQAEQKFGWNGA